MTGVMNQLPTIPLILPHSTACGPTVTHAKPITAPIIEWVVDTGHPINDAINSHNPAESKALIIPNTKTSGSATNSIGSIIPLFMVSVTSPPAKYAPANSNTIAIIIACLAVIVPDPTDVPIAFDTSLAPIPNAINKPKIAVIATNIVPYSLSSSIVFPLCCFLLIMNGQALIQYVTLHAEPDLPVHRSIQRFYIKT